MALFFSLHLVFTSNYFYSWVVNHSVICTTEGIERRALKPKGNDLSDHLEAIYVSLFVFQNVRLW
jgi:hypothetical protein